MRRMRLLAGILFLAYLTGCGNGTAREAGAEAVETDKSAEKNESVKLYTLVLDEEVLDETEPDDREYLLPELVLDWQEGTFQFSYDVLSSYLASGTFSENGDQLELVTEDGKKRYLFAVSDADTLRFVEDGSSDISLIDKGIGVEFSDGALFSADRRGEWEAGDAEPAENGAMGKDQESAEIQEAAESWASAFCRRDGKAIYALYDPENRDEFYDMEYVQSSPEDDYIAIGMSSPWPMDYLYTIETEGRRTEFTYYPMTSDPHRWAWKEAVSWKEREGQWYGCEEELFWGEQIISAREFWKVYAGGIKGTPMDYRTGCEGWAENLAKQAEEGPYSRMITEPERAMEYLLNLSGGSAQVVSEEKDAAWVVYTFADESQVKVRMEKAAGEIWLPGEAVGE